MADEKKSTTKTATKTATKPPKEKPLESVPPAQQPEPTMRIFE